MEGSRILNAVYYDKKTMFFVCQKQHPETNAFPTVRLYLNKMERYTILVNDELAISTKSRSLFMREFRRLKQQYQLVFSYQL